MRAAAGSPVTARVRFELSPSPRLAAAIVAAHAAAGAALVVSFPTAAGIALAALLVALGVTAAWSRALLRSPGSVRAIELRGGEAAFELASGASELAPVAERRYVTRSLVLLPLGAPLSRTLLVSADMLPAPEFRRLRLWALWNRLPGVARQQLAA